MQGLAVLIRTYRIYPLFLVRVNWAVYLHFGILNRWAVPGQKEEIISRC